MGCSLYFALTGIHLLLPFNVVEANYLLPPPESLMSTTDLIACRATALQKHQENLENLKDCIHQAHNKAAIKFECGHSRTIRDLNFKAGDLILIHNTAIEKALNCKMRPHYFEPMVIISRNQGDAYIISNLDRTLSHTPIATFQVIPYFICLHLNIPDIEQHLNISVSRLWELENSTMSNPDNHDTLIADNDNDDDGIPDLVEADSISET